MMTSGDVPQFDRLIACGELLVPTSWLGNDRLAGLKLTAGAFAEPILTTKLSE